MIRQYLWATLFALITPAVLAGSNVYRFNVDGQIIIKDTVPADLAPLGYQVLNGQGMVIRTVPRELTAEEIAERDHKLEQERQLQARIDKRKTADRALLRLYSSISDVDRALKRKSDEVLAHIELQKRRSLDVQEKLESAQQVAANMERRGQEVSPELKAEISQYQQAIKDNELGVEERKNTLVALDKEYKNIRHRLQVLAVYPLGTLPEDVDVERLQAEVSK
jgi:hypothetical protein